MWVLTLLLGLLVVLAITAATGWFVAQEFAYMTVDRSRLTSRAAQGDQAAENALEVTRRTSFMLSGAQLGITVTALLVGFVAEPLIGEAVGEGLGGVGVPTGVGIAIGTTFALVFSTFVQMLFGELFPKNLAIAKPEPVALWLSRSTNLYLTFFGWLIAVFDKAAEKLLRLIGMEPVHDVEYSASRADLARIVAESRESGDLPKDLSLMIDRLLEFPDQDVDHAMIPRARVGSVRAEDTIAELWATMGAGHSRYPVLDEQDDVVGVVHLQDVLATHRDDRAAVSTIMRPAVLVPALMSLPDALGALNRSGEQLACVLDEHGGLAGVVTLEDLAEELVGEIGDEHDPDDDVPAPTPHDTDDDTPVVTWELPGSLHLDEVSRLIDRELPDDVESETLGGLVVEQHGALADVGTTVALELPATAASLLLPDGTTTVLRMQVLAVERHVPSLARITLEQAQADDLTAREALAGTHPQTDPTADPTAEPAADPVADPLAGPRGERTEEHR